jgi:hypothetical protein
VCWLTTILLDKANQIRSKALLKSNQNLWIPKTGKCRMFKVLILVCSINLAPSDCDIKNAIDVMAGPMSPNELSCGVSAQAFLASTALSPSDGEYVKIQCKRPSTVEAENPDNPPVD